LVEIESHISVDSASNKSFGVVFSVVFLVIAFYPVLDGAAIRVWSLIISMLLYCIALLRSDYLAPLNKLWHDFGIRLGGIVAPLVMTLVYFASVVPVALLMRLFGVDLLKSRIDKSASSYWIDRTSRSVSSMKNQF